MAGEPISLYCATGMSMALTRDPVRVRRVPGLRILCQAGVAWVSEYRCRDDYVLGAGDTVRLRGNRDIVMSGLPDARVALFLEPTS
ncbi:MULTISPECIES: DUF2917 domain-containing protein [Bordetella]|jgi:hypothetical protein|nr:MULTISPECIES: DUF2917 domain-containing protein [Bordetella]